jgi:hypothetical protein
MTEQPISMLLLVIFRDHGVGLGMALNSAMRTMRPGQIPVPPSATSRLLYELFGRALSEYGVVPELFILFIYGAPNTTICACMRASCSGNSAWK